MLRGRESDGFPVFQEKFIRECIRKFPYCDVTLLQQLVRSIAPVEIVSRHQRPPQALSCQSGCGLSCFDWCVSTAAGQRPDGSVGADPGHHRAGGLHGRRVLYYVRRKGSSEEMLSLQSGRKLNLPVKENFVCCEIVVE